MGNWYEKNTSSSCNLYKNVNCLQRYVTVGKLEVSIATVCDLETKSLGKPSWEFPRFWSRVCLWHWKTIFTFPCQKTERKKKRIFFSSAARLSGSRFLRVRENLVSWAGGLKILKVTRDNALKLLHSADLYLVKTIIQITSFLNIRKLRSHTTGLIFNWDVNGLIICQFVNVSQARIRRSILPNLKQLESQLLHFVTHLR